MKHTKKYRFLPAAALALAVLMTLASCSSKSDVGRDEAPNYSPPADEKVEAEGMGDAMAPGNTTQPGANGDYERKIIRTVKMTCETKGYDEAITVILSVLSTRGGYVETSSATGTGYEDVKGSERRASYTFRVPADQLDGFLEDLRSDGGIRILTQDAASNEITAQYYDTVSRLETLEAERASLTAMLEGFTDYNDISAMLQVQERLYNVIEEIEALKTRLNLYDGQVAMSTVHLTLNEVITYTEVPVKEPTFGERISEAFTESWIEFGEGCQDAAVWLVESFPSLLVLGVIGGGVAIFVVAMNRRARRRRSEGGDSSAPKPPYRPGGDQ